jgi:excisionase family DNA binding protein
MRKASAQCNHCGTGGARLPAQLLTVEGLARFLSVEISFVRRLVVERRMPYFRLGRYVRFDPDEVARWIEGQKVGAEADMSSGRRGGRR